MKRAVPNWKLWAIVAATLAIGGTLVPLAALGSGGDSFTATPYADVIRFKAQGVASLQVQIFDLSGRKLWDSGVVSGNVVDWNRTNEWGERLAFGTYLYAAQGWNASGGLIFAKSGKLALLPGDKVQLQQAPILELPPSPQAPTGITPPTLGPLAYHYTNLYVKGRLGVGTDTPSYAIHHVNPWGAAYIGATSTAHGITYLMGTSIARETFIGSITKHDLDLRTGNVRGRLHIVHATGNVGINTTSPAAKLDVRNTASQAALRIESSAGTNLIEAYNTGSGRATGLVFRVERATGNVRADGAFYGAGFHTGSADVAEHVNASEVLEPGDVVEIDPENPQHFRLASTPGSRLVAGVISTEPGVVLGSNADPMAGDVDPRPLLALAGRVPVKATTENGPIQVGDLLISSSKPGYAMRCTDPASAVGAIIGKALEPLEEGEGLIVIQVTLR